MATAKWRTAENYLSSLLASGSGAFNSTKMAADLGLSGREATHLIQSYLGAQRRPKSTTAYVLHRTGQTKNAVWTIGVRTGDVRDIGTQFVGDMALRLQRAIEPDLIRMGVINGRVAKVAGAIATAIAANIAMLEASL